MSTGLAGFRPCFRGVLDPLWILYSFCFSSADFPELGGKELNRDVSSKAEDLKVSHCLYIVSVFVHLLQEEASLMLAEQGADLRVHRTSIGVISLPHSCVLGQ